MSDDFINQTEPVSIRGSERILAVLEKAAQRHYEIPQRFDDWAKEYGFDVRFDSDRSADLASAPGGSGAWRVLEPSIV